MQLIMWRYSLLKPHTRFHSQASEQSAHNQVSLYMRQYYEDDDADVSVAHLVLEIGALEFYIFGSLWLRP